LSQKDDAENPQASEDEIPPEGGIIQELKEQGGMQTD
jgi:hypothetical protein